MIRKLISLGLSSLGVLTLLGAGVVQAEETSNHNVKSTEFISAALGADFAQVVAVTPQIEVESSLPVTGEDADEEVLEKEEETSSDLEDDSQVGQEDTIEEDTTSEEEPVLGGVTQEDVEALLQETALHSWGDNMLLVNGFPVNEETNRVVEDGVTYVNFTAMAKALDASAECGFNGATGLATVQTDLMYMEGRAGQYYFVANDRYIYVEETLRAVEGDLLVPLSALVKAFDAQLYWERETGVTSVVTGSGALESGDTFYPSDELFWMSRVVFAESGNEPVKGQMGVAMVVYTRVADPRYPDTVLGVLSQQNQFSTYRNGNLANRTPNASSIIAAKLVMDGGQVKELIGATHFDSLADSWADRNLSTIMVIGGHTFYI